MKHFVVMIAVLLIFGHSLTQVSPIYDRYHHDQSLKKVDLFLSPTFKMPMEIGNWLKLPADDLLWIDVFLVIWLICKRISRKAAFIAFAYLIYHILDAIFWWWDYRTSFWMNYLSFGATTVNLIILLLPIKEGAKIINFE